MDSGLQELDWGEEPGGGRSQVECLFVWGLGAAGRNWFRVPARWLPLVGDKARQTLWGERGLLGERMESMESGEALGSLGGKTARWRRELERESIVVS